MGGNGTSSFMTFKSILQYPKEQDINFLFVYLILVLVVILVVIFTKWRRKSEPASTKVQVVDSAATMGIKKFHFICRNALKKSHNLLIILLLVSSCGAIPAVILVNALGSDLNNIKSFVFGGLAVFLAGFQGSLLLGIRNALSLLKRKSQNLTEAEGTNSDSPNWFTISWKVRSSVTLGDKVKLARNFGNFLEVFLLLVEFIQLVSLPLGDWHRSRMFQIIGASYSEQANSFSNAIAVFFTLTSPFLLVLQAVSIILANLVLLILVVTPLFIYHERVLSSSGEPKCGTRLYLAAKVFVNTLYLPVLSVLLRVMRCYCDWQNGGIGGSNTAIGYSSSELCYEFVVVNPRIYLPLVIVTYVTALPLMTIYLLSNDDENENATVDQEANADKEANTDRQEVQIKNTVTSLLLFKNASLTLALNYLFFWTDSFSMLRGCISSILSASLLTFQIRCGSINVKQLNCLRTLNLVVVTITTVAITVLLGGESVFVPILLKSNNAITWFWGALGSSWVLVYIIGYLRFIKK